MTNHTSINYYTIHIEALGGFDIWISCSDLRRIVDVVRRLIRPSPGTLPPEVEALFAQGLPLHEAAPGAEAPFTPEQLRQAVACAMQTPQEPARARWMGLWFVFKRYPARFPFVGAFPEFMELMNTTCGGAELPMPCNNSYDFYKNDAYFTDPNIRIQDWNERAWAEYSKAPWPRRYKAHHLLAIQRTALAFMQHLHLHE